MDALLRGLPVLCEKPLAETVRECLTMVAAAEVSGKLLMVSQSRRYFRTGEAFGRQLAELGAVGSLSCEFFKAPRFGGFREQMAEPLLVDMAIHQFDLARKLIGTEPLSVYCDSYNPEWSWFDGQRGRGRGLHASTAEPASPSPAAGAPRPGNLLERPLASEHRRTARRPGTATAPHSVS